MWRASNIGIWITFRIWAKGFSRHTLKSTEDKDKLWHAFERLEVEQMKLKENWKDHNT